ncbi:transcriptional regulator, AraC family [Enhydrobacter aerosaccus]|uniref:Transcriptional regulator, AraC family n=1 Tax=Enhydrobacter aerosaccus TaxID=225324 RepID=A0A1T4MRC0_9HYPH|nr:DJ-1/PfpI family protein [Enhydrobacter aerosaccus]SJZ69609.1 transcriptional regulator, AraC family [Enhydrobacter aerosaccus]
MTQRRFGFLMFPAFGELDLIGPWEMATMWNAYAGGPQCLTVAATAGPIRCAKGLAVSADVGFDDCPSLDYLLIPGGFSAFDAAQDPEVVRFVRERAATARAVLSVCTGAFILAAAGLLRNRTATTHWKALDRLAAMDGITVRQERWVRDGAIWTSAGVSAGIDLLLAFIAAEDGDATAGTVQFNAEYYPEGKTYGDAHRGSQAPTYVRRLP